MTYVATLPADKEKVYLKVQGDVDLDLELIASDDTILIKFVSGSGWVHGSISDSDAVSFEHNGMSIKSCVDRCSEDITITVTQWLHFYILTQELPFLSKMYHVSLYASPNNNRWYSVLAFHQYFGGQTFTFSGDAAFSSEWVYIDKTTEKLTLSVAGCKCRFHFICFA